MDKKPNIILITTDQMRRDTLGVSGNEQISTPYLDMFAKHGCVFDKAYSAVPSCIAARAAMLSGLSQKSHRRVGYQDGVTWDYEHTIASEFADNGYHTQCVGKMHVHPERNLCGFHNVILHDGYLHHSRDYTKAAAGSHEKTDDYLYWLKERRGINADLIDSGLECNSWVARTWPYEEELHPTNWCVTQSINFLRRRDPGKPFFLYTSFVRPHSPLDPPEYYYRMYEQEPLAEPLVGSWAKQTDEEGDGLDIDCKYGILRKSDMKRAKAAYYASITHIDHQIGRLVQAVREYHLEKNTIFLFTSDHGDMMGDHNFFRKGLPYEGSCGIPLLIYDPGGLLGIPPCQKSHRLIELRDILPTLLDMAGLPVPSSIEGVSALKALGSEAPLREYIHGEHELGAYSNQFIVTERDKYIWFSQSGREQYFDLTEDPGECTDLIDSPGHQERIGYLKGKLAEELEGREEGFAEKGRLCPGKQTVSVLKNKAECLTVQPS